MSCPSITRLLCIVLLSFSMAAVQGLPAWAQAPPVSAPGVQVGPSSAGATGVQAAGTSGPVVQPGAGIGGQLGQAPIPGGSQVGTGSSGTGSNGTLPSQARGPVRLPNQNCGGLGQCAWAGQSQATAACTADARVCTSTSTDPDWSGTRCSAVGALRTCSSNNGGLIIQNPLPGTTSTGMAPNGQLGTGTSGTGNTSTLPGLCPNC
jgi:hypothetical protein